VQTHLIVIEKYIPGIRADKVWCCSGAEPRRQWGARDSQNWPVHRSVKCSSILCLTALSEI